jgi:Ca2+-binding EF-hand superfamily protein
MSILVMSTIDWRSKLRPVAAPEVIDFEQRAFQIFGRKHTEYLIRIFKREANRRGYIEAYILEYLLRYCGLSPSKKEVVSFCAELNDDVVTLENFLDFAIRCESVSKTSNLIDFFSPYDPDNSGMISENVFKSIMLNCGEKFTPEELDAVMQTFCSEQNMGFIDYRTFLTTYV